VPFKLLLADDSVTIQRVIELTFADEDVQVIAVGDGDQAIARIDAESPDIVLADVGMPGRDGYQVAEHVKRSPRLAHVPVLLLTGAFEPVDEARAAAAGCDGVLAKPFEPQLVISRVRELLERGAQARAAETRPAAEARPAIEPGPAVDLAREPRPAPVDEAPARPPAPNVDVEGLDEYFDRLDQAFATRAAGSEPAPARPAGPEPIDWYAASEPAAGEVPDEWDLSEETSADLPLSYASPAPAFSAAAAAEAPGPARDAVASPPAAAESAPAPAPVATPILPPALPPLPSLADAFSALLAAEQASADATAARWPAAPHAPAGPAGAAPIDDEVIEAVARRVLERLTDRVVRDTASEIITRVAERLVRDEIDRIKASIR
jgi:CheY-like chemotaxis protein